MEFLGALFVLSVGCVFLYFMQKWAYKKEKEFAELKARVIGQWIADAIISAVEEIKK